MKTTHGLIPLLLVASLWSAGCDGSDDIETDILTLTATFSLDDTDVSFTDFVANIRYGVEEVSENVVANGAVLVFIDDLEGTWRALPFAYGVEAPDQPVVDYTVSMGYAYDTGFIDVFVEASSSADVVWDEVLDDPLFSSSRRIRFVIFNTFIAGKSGIDVTDYEALRDRYGLPE